MQKESPGGVVAQNRGLTPDEKRETEEALGVSPDMSLGEKAFILAIIFLIVIVSLWYWKLPPFA